MLALMMDSTSSVVKTRLTVSLISSQGSSSAFSVGFLSLDLVVIALVVKGSSTASGEGLCLLFLVLVPLLAGDRSLYQCVFQHLL